MSRKLIGAAALLSFSLPAFAVAAPEIDGSLAIQFIALGAGVMMLFKRKK